MTLLAAFLAAVVRRPVAWRSAQIAAKVEAFHGEMGVYAKNLDTGEMIAVNADQRFPTASLIKLAVMAEVFHQIAEGEFAKTTPITLRDDAKAGDETVPLNMLHDGTVLTVGDLSTS